MENEKKTKEVAANVTKLDVQRKRYEEMSEKSAVCENLQRQVDELTALVAEKVRKIYEYKFCMHNTNCILTFDRIVETPLNSIFMNVFFIHIECKKGSSNTFGSFERFGNDSR